MIMKCVAAAIALIVVLAVAFAGAFVTGAAVWLLWNYVVPAVFHLPEIGYLQAVALTVLATLLFKTSVSSD